METCSLNELAERLQRTLHFRNGGQNPRKGFRALLLRKVQRVKLKMYQEKGHSLPHLHVDLGGANHHSASFAIDPPARLKGMLPAREEVAVLAWIAANKADLVATWRSLQDGNLDDVALAKLRSGE